MAISEPDATVHSAVQEEGGEEATALGRGGLKGGHLKGFQHLWDPPWYGDLLQIPGESDIGGGWRLARGVPEYRKVEGAVEEDGEDLQ